VATVRSMLKAKGLPRWFCGEAVNTAVYVLNRCLMKSVDGMTLVDATSYRSIVGSLRYLVNTCPDLAFVVGYVSHFLE
jgi:hypothetical protein